MKKLICAFLVTMLILGVSVAATATSEPTLDSVVSSEPVSEPVTTDPIVTDPSASEPDLTDPSVTEPSVSQPDVTDPSVTEPSVSDPATPGTVTLTPIGANTFLPGQTITILVSVSGNSPAWALEYIPVFDSTLFALEPGGVQFLKPIQQENGTLVFFSDPNNPQDINGDLLMLTLRILETAQPGQYEIGCNLAAFMGIDQLPLQTLAPLTVVIECPHILVQDPLALGALATPATCTQPATYYHSCSVCGALDTVTPPFAFGEALPHVFDRQMVAPEYLKDPGTCSREQTYYLSCSGCGLCSPNVETDFFQAAQYYGDHVFDNDCDEYCNECGRFQQAKHIAGSEWFSDHEEHWHKCITCGINMDYQKHKPGPMSAGDKTQVCTVCQYEISDETQEHICSYDGQWHSNDSNHWRECECGKQANMAPHQWDAGATVTQPTADKEGLIIYTCTVCQHERKQYIPATGEPQQPTDYPSLPTTPIQPVVIEQESGPNWPAIILGILLAISLIGNGVMAFFLTMASRRPKPRRKA